MPKYIISMIICFFGITNCSAQITFQKQFSQPDSASSFETFDAKQTPDGGYVLAGLASDGFTSTYHPFLVKLNCKGEKVWQRFFGNSQTAGNIFPKVIITKDSDYVMINNIGAYSNYNGLAIRLDESGNIIWQKTLNLSSGNDIISDIKETKDGHFIITGASKNTPDVSLTKLNSDGTLIWNKTFGNNGEYDEGSAIIETNDGGYLISGRYISMLTFNAFLLKTDSSGSMQWLKCYGDTNQHMWGFDIKELNNGDIIMVGSTTLLKPSYSSYSDNFIMRLKSDGDTLWTKIFYGSPDYFESASSVEVDDNDNFIIGIATASYPTSGFVPNKHAIIKFSSSGNLLMAKTYNSGSSHYTRISKTNDNGYLLCGFSNNYSYVIGFQTLLMKLDENLSSGCFETDQTSNTIVQTKPFKITQPLPVLGNAGSVVNNTASWTTTFYDSTLCSTYPILKGDFVFTSTCIGLPSLFTSDSTGIISWHWDFGDIGSGDTSILMNPSYTYSSTGTYTVTLIISNGCESDTIKKAITIVAPSAQLSLGDDREICVGTSITIGTSINSNYYAWNTSASTPNITVSQAGTYILTIDITPCGLYSDTIEISTINCDTIPPQPTCIPYLPNAFSPNGDDKNETFRILFPAGQLDLEFLKIEIYNRWGNQVFTSTNLKQGWDGRHQGKDQNIDTYYYFVRYRCGKETRTIKGDLLLIR